MTIIKQAFSIEEFCTAYSVGRSLAYEEMSEGRLQYRKVGRRVVIRKVDADRWLDDLPVGDTVKFSKATAA
ncbi:DNA-binding protein [Mesorhizobium sp. M7D.F.Ca.US.005.01.1.1]|uniref:helix-turn-helix domain-containing protein n=1 Tax=Mesorhizobium sp. M7D.F.Ca.US.005.01.1.1 TaxID=2493678 RepID=UPI000F756529|nr:helix-turn-helix domain-containing protein [Mesorhizobium sp. M7D.F.Ca.US.005.01.1.1]AZO45910.1 DNA-binding protein [Mesorhizobium sp. M7D.F.Ca.US.005.01.1.1]